MAWDQLAIINMALNKLNMNSVDDIANSGVFANSAESAFNLLYPSAISGKSWRFATTTQLLNALVTPPPIDRWTYQLQLPSNYLAAVRTYPQIDFQIYENVMYTNNNNVQLEYRFLPNVTHLPAYFVHYFVVLLAAWFANTVAQDSKLQAELASEAQVLLGEALFTDSQSHPTPSMYNNPLIQARSNVWNDYDRPPNN